MNKPVRVIFFFIIFVSIFVSLTHLSHANFLIRPIPEESVNSNQQSVISNQQSIIPSVTFGDLLSGNSSSAEDNSAISTSEETPQIDTLSRAEAIKKILAKLEESYQESVNSNQLSVVSNQQPTTSYPTPYIPIPTLVAGVSEIIANQQVTDNRLSRTENQQSIPNNTGEPNENPIKTTYTIALLGDSMTDTLGKDLLHLKQLLARAYPLYSFALLNYGQGSTDLDSGLYRLTHETSYLGQEFPPLLSYQPDILVVESFAYNHWGGQFYDLDRQWLTIAKIIDTIKENSPDTKIILAATIAPNAHIFGDGILNWQADKKWESVNITKAYLQNLVNFATSQNYPLADAYHQSLGVDGNGLVQYINQGDHLHPSGEGALLFSQQIVEAIKNNKLIE